jgi:hypothetical protein
LAKAGVCLQEVTSSLVLNILGSFWAAGSPAGEENLLQDWLSLNGLF